jgi:hypothetical protein
MSRRACLWAFGLLLLARTAAAQGPIFDPDDFLDPRLHQGFVFASRLVIGESAGFIDGFRPAHQNARIFHLANSVYGPKFQFDFKHTDIRGDGPPAVSVCPCDPPIYFPTPPSDRATPAAPPPGRRETLQFAYYHATATEGAEAAPMLRYRVSWTWQPISTTVRFLDTPEIAARLSGREQTFAADADIYFHLSSHPVRGSLFLIRTISSGTVADRNQTALTWMSRFPPLLYRGVFFRATLAVGGVSGRGGAALNLVSPAFEAFWHDPHTRANLHLIWNPQSAQSGREGWQTHHQVVVYLDRAFLRITKG